MDVRGKIILKKPTYKVLALMASTVVLLVLPFVKSELAWVSFMCLLPLFFALETMYKERWTSKKIITAIWLSGWLYLACVTLWILQINTSLWSYAQNVPLGRLIVFTWLTCSLVLSIGFLIFGWIIVALQAHKTILRFVLIVPSAWIVSEFIRSWINSLVFIGPEGTLGAFYNFGNLGFAAVNTPLGYASRLVGLYGLSFLVVIVNTSLYWMIKRRFRLPFLTISFALFFALIGYYVYQKPATPTKHVVAFQLGMEHQRFYDEELRNLLYAEQGTVTNPAELVVLPEHASFFEQGDIQNRQTIIQALTRERDALFVYSRQAPGPRGLSTNQIVYKTSDDVELSTQEKNFLIPTGEYLPFIHQFVLKIIGHNQIISIFNTNTGFAKGEYSEHPVTYNSVSYGALACSGAIAPELYRAMALQGAEVLVNSAALNVFKDSPLYREQSESMIRFSAIANAKPFIQSARGSYAYIFNQNGKTLARAPNLDIGIVRADVSPSSVQTLYTKFGEFFVLVSVIILLGFYIYFRQQPKNNKVQSSKRKLQVK